MTSWRIPKDNTALLIIDAQEKLIAAMPNPQYIEKRIATATHVAKALEIPIHITEQSPQKLGSTLASIKQAAGEKAFYYNKTTFSALSALPVSLPKYLLICGLETHVCVRQTIYDLRAKEYIPYLLADAVASRHAIDHDTALRELSTDRILITTLEAITFEILQSADHPQFKTIQNYIKLLT
jgi:nicotinamidase-related amidase